MDPEEGRRQPVLDLVQPLAVTVTLPLSRPDQAFVGLGSYLTLLGRIGFDRVAYVTVLLPIVALALSTAFEGLTWSPVQFVGLAVAIAANAFALGRFERGPLGAPAGAD